MSSFDLFSQIQVGYMLVESERLAEWKRFAKDGLGLHLEEEREDILAFRIDAHQRRLIVRRGVAEDVVAIGIQLHDDSALQEVKSRLLQRKIAFMHGDQQGALERGVKAYWTLEGPKKMSVEFFTDALITSEPLRMLTSGFITGSSGMSHAAITSRKPEKILQFWQEIFDARVSDTIEEKIAGVMMDIKFLRFNERHHSIAIAATRGLRMDPIRTKVQHINLLVTSMDDLVAAYRRLLNLGFEMAHEIGQHPNDKELSFYVQSPSGFEVELGWNALTVDEATWKVNDYYGISLWGHKPRNASRMNFISTNTGNLLRGLKSLLHTEYSPL